MFSRAVGGRPDRSRRADGRFLKAPPMRNSNAISSRPTAAEDPAAPRRHEGSYSHPYRWMPWCARSTRLGVGLDRATVLGLAERLINVQRQRIVPTRAARVLLVLRLDHVPFLDLRRHLPQQRLGRRSQDSCLL